jgi:hypothetical protein
LNEAGHHYEVLHVGHKKLQPDRHEADYDPLHRVSKTDAILSVWLARSAITSSRLLLRMKRKPA